MINACVIGWPISHSRSPLIHGYWLKLYGIDGSYTRQPVEPQNLAAFLTSMRELGFSGCNVTIPHKERAFELVKPADLSTERLGAANTLYYAGSELVGTNTDGEGFINSLKASAPEIRLDNACAVVLGAGGAASAIVNALQMEGMTEIRVCNRSPERSLQLRQRFGPGVVPVEWSKRGDVLDDCSLLVNTTSLGMQGQPKLDIDLSNLAPQAVVSDIVYTPLRTGLLRQSAAQGNVVVEGLGMLLHQAVRGFELWFGTRPSVTAELHDLVAADIERASRP